jgi:hypothetical protein
MNYALSLVALDQAVAVLVGQLGPRLDGLDPYALVANVLLAAAGRPPAGLPVELDPAPAADPVCLLGPAGPMRPDQLDMLDRQAVDNFSRLLRAGAAVRAAAAGPLTRARVAAELVELLDRAGCVRLEIVRSPGGRLGGYCVTAGPSGRPGEAFNIADVLPTAPPGA